MSIDFNSLTKEEQREFLINKVLEDDYFVDFHKDFREKFDIKDDNDLYKNYIDAINELYLNQSRYKDLYYDVFNARRKIDLHFQSKNITDNDIDRLIELYNETNNRFYELDLDQIGLDRSISRMFKNKYISEKIKTKYKKYYEKTKDKIYSDDEDYGYELKNILND